MLLTKSRLTLLVLLTTWAGFYLGMPSVQLWGPNGILLLHTLLGTALVAAAASALNQLLEIEIDSRMNRTQDRPLPAGRMHPDHVMIFAFISGSCGLLYLFFVVNPLASLLSAATLGSYVWIYTPMKQTSTLNTLVGAIPGALPPVIGWAAATGTVTMNAWILFLIMFFWQMPHFLAIAWFCKEDYEKAGLKMLPVVDPSGQSTGRQAVVYTATLLPISLMPALNGMAGGVYFAIATIAGLGFLLLAARFCSRCDTPSARQLFFASIFYLPLVLISLCWTKNVILQ
jgi:protoheme IX farnesyltransferase